MSQNSNDILEAISVQLAEAQKNLTTTPRHLGDDADQLFEVYRAEFMEIVAQYNQPGTSDLRRLHTQANVLNDFIRGFKEKCVKFTNEIDELHESKQQMTVVTPHEPFKLDNALTGTDSPELSSSTPQNSGPSLWDKFKSGFIGGADKSTGKVSDSNKARTFRPS